MSGVWACLVPVWELVFNRGPDSWAIRAGTWAEANLSQGLA